jgi:hypothetical protein
MGREEVWLGWERSQLNYIVHSVAADCSDTGLALPHFSSPAWR